MMVLAVGRMYLVLHQRQWVFIRATLVRHSPQDSVTQKTARSNKVVIFSVVMVGRLGLDLSQGLFLPFWTRSRLARKDKKQATQKANDVLLIARD